MEKNIAIAIVILLQSLTFVNADAFVINGKEIVVPAPEDFARVTDEMTVVMKIVQQMADPLNDTLAYYIMEFPLVMRGWRQFSQPPAPF